MSVSVKGWKRQPFVTMQRRTRIEKNVVFLASNMSHSIGNRFNMKHTYVWYVKCGVFSFKNFKLITYLSL